MFVCLYSWCWGSRMLCQMQTQTMCQARFLRLVLEFSSALIAVYSPLGSVSHTTVNKTHQPPCRGWICHLNLPVCLLLSILVIFAAVFHNSAHSCKVTRNPVLGFSITEQAVMRQLSQKLAPCTSTLAGYKMWTFTCSFPIVAGHRGIVAIHVWLLLL